MAASVVVYDARGDAHRLHDAMAGLGTNDSRLIEIIGGRTRQQLQHVVTVYKELFGKTLIQDLHGDTSGNFRKILIKLVLPIGEFMADEVHDAVDRPGTNERALIDIITQASPEEIVVMKAGWTAKYHGSLETAVAGDTSFNFRKVLLQTLRGTRMAPGHVDASRVDRDAAALYKAGEGRPGTNDDTFIEIISGSSAEHLQAVSEAYKKLGKHHSIEEAIKNETSGDFMHALIALCTPRAKYMAQRVHDAISGLGTNDASLVRLFCFNGKEVIQAAAEEYHKMFKHTIDQDIRGDTSGDYRDLLLYLVHHRT
ncbi:annexin VII [Pelomyxa schiedti]|nr:annexin VII [Pelomyxa schiedti]